MKDGGARGHLWRRMGIAFGAALLVLGLGMTWYANEQQQAVRSERRVIAWAHGERIYSREMWPSRRIFAWGVGAMAVGAGVTAYSLVPMGRRSESGNHL